MPGSFRKPPPSDTDAARAEPRPGGPVGGVAIRLAVPGDGPAIAEVQRATWLATYHEWIPEAVAGLDPVRTAGNWARASRQPGDRVALALVGGTIIGYAWSGPADERADGELLALYVHPDAQRQGAGRLLLADALAWMSATGRVRCLVWALERHAPARRFYERAGFALDEGHNRSWRGLTEIRYSRAVQA
ncbi:GNAT family N-acetyltransferase [Luedemannella helvata]|uniref:GNAT family N-acetyltransferase n=1 Tax=Luedemannella helvata TaxID=349315 RepID=A0ABN2JUE2_9ACTN